jgi:hypothetical protein
MDRMKEKHFKPLTLPSLLNLVNHVNLVYPLHPPIST